MKKNKKQFTHSINFRMDDKLYNSIVNNSRGARLTKGEYL